jgi:hypothetical protein
MAPPEAEVQLSILSPDYAATPPRASPVIEEGACSDIARTHAVHRFVTGTRLATNGSPRVYCYLYSGGGFPSIASPPMSPPDGGKTFTIRSVRCESALQNLGRRATCAINTTRYATENHTSSDNPSSWDHPTCFPIICPWCIYLALRSPFLISISSLSSRGR